MTSQQSINQRLARNPYLAATFTFVFLATAAGLGAGVLPAVPLLIGLFVGIPNYVTAVWDLSDESNAKGDQATRAGGSLLFIFGVLLMIFGAFGTGYAVRNCVLHLSYTDAHTNTAIQDAKLAAVNFTVYVLGLVLVYLGVRYRHKMT